MTSQSLPAPRNSIRVAPFGAGVIAKVRAGDQDALVLAMAALGQAFLRNAGLGVCSVYASDVARLDGAKAGLGAAATDLMRLLANAPQGRKALRDLGFEPVFEHIEAE